MCRQSNSVHIQLIDHADLQRFQNRISAEDFAWTNLISGLILKVNGRQKLI